MIKKIVTLMVALEVLAGISMIAYGNSVNIAMYAVSLVCIVTFINAFACNCGFAICANFKQPKKEIDLLLLMSIHQSYISG